MATRATYEFSANTFTPRTTFYVHWDGYPEGAAYYFSAMMNYKSEAPNLSLADKFIKAVNGAEITQNGDGLELSSHADAEYHYVVNEKEMKIKIYARNGESEWIHEGTENIEDFITSRTS